MSEDSGQKPWTARHPLITIIGIVAAIVVAVAIVASQWSPSSSSAQQAGTGTPDSTGTVTYVVNGDLTDVTYGPAGSQLQGASPITNTEPLGSRFITRSGLSCRVTAA